MAQVKAGNVRFRQYYRTEYEAAVAAREARLKMMTHSIETQINKER